MCQRGVKEDEPAGYSATHRLLFNDTERVSGLVVMGHDGLEHRERYDTAARTNRGLCAARCSQHISTSTVLLSNAALSVYQGVTHMFSLLSCVCFLVGLFDFPLNYSRYSRS